MKKVNYESIFGQRRHDNAGCRRDRDGGQCLQTAYANASSVHSMGQAAGGLSGKCARNSAGAIHANPGEIYFTSGGTESDNTALLGYCLAHRDKGNHIITTEIEHHAVLAICWKLESLGFDVTYVPPAADGVVRFEDIVSAVRDDTILISVMHVNNEIGTIQDIASIGEYARERGIAFHTDAVQSFCKLDLEVKAMAIDMMSVSAHKFHGPKERVSFISKKV
jgi:cysteine desulfurase